jgi:translocation and assembly module TamB
MRRLRKIVLWMLAALATLVLLAAVAGVLIVRSDRFHQYIQRRIVEEAQRATGAHVELGGFALDWHNLTVQVQGLVLHGRETPAEPPLLQVSSAILGLRIISVLETKIDLASLRVERPQAYFVVYPDGSTNFPGPPGRSDKLWSEELLNLKVGAYEIVDGLVEYDGRRIPLHLKGEHLRVRMNYEAQTPSYRGDVSTDSLQVTVEGYGPIPTSMSATFALEKSRILLPRVHVATKESSADLSGTLDDPRSPHGTFSMKSNASVREAVRIFHLPIEPTGSASFDGQVNVAFDQPLTSILRGRVIARGLGYTQDRLKIEGAEVRGDLQLDRDRLTLKQMTAKVMGADVAGQANLEHGREFHMEGTIDGLDLRRAAAILTDRPIAWSGTMAGTFSADATVGQPQTKAHAILGVIPVAGGAPVEAHLDVAYDQAAGTVALGSSSFATPATRAEVSGTLGKMLQVRLRSTDLNDLLPALAMVEENPPTEIPLKLRNGSVTADGSVTGPLDDPRFRGQVTVSNGEIQGHGFERFTGEIDATRMEINGTRLAVSRGSTTASGAVRVTAREGSFADAGVTGQIELRNAPVGELAREAGSTVEITGTGSANVRLAGSVRRPELEVALDVQQPAAFGEHVDRVRADAHYRPGELDIANGIANDGMSELRFSGNYRHPEGNLKSGDVSFDVTAQNVTASRIGHVAKISPPVDGQVGGRLRGNGRIANGSFELTAATVDLTGQRITVDGEPIGDLTVTAETKGTEMTVRAGGNIRESVVEVSGKWRLEGDAPGEATVRFSRMSIDSVHDLAMLGQTRDRSPAAPPFEGFVEGGATVTLPLQKLDAFRARVTLDTVQVNPRPSQVLRLGVQQQDVILKNSQPLVVDITHDRVQLSPSQFTGRNTNVSVEGAIPFRGAAGADFSVRGNIDLVILQLINRDLVAKGIANVQVSIRGNLQDPNVNGRLQFSKASLYYADLPYVVDNADGSIAFDRNRATIERLAAETGGGTINFTGSLDFGAALDSGTALVYRLQAEARRVRVRLPQDLSATFDSSLRLTGASDASTLSGSVTLNRASFNPRSDLGQLLAQASAPTAIPTAPNEYLQGMRLDVRIQSASNFQVETSLTRNVEAEVDLRLRGSPVRPVLQGTVSVNQGEVQVFGTRYTINRGDIRFLNPVKIEPTVDMDLETKLRGITVNVTLAGPPGNLKMNWSSDPPLQQSEIIGLLATGRDPSLALNQTAPGVSGGGGSNFAAAGTGLVGQALNAQLNSRFQRFFGATRVKIDPTLVGVDNLPQARLTWEQQVSKDVTLTYITNLNRTQEQLIQVQWDLDKSWSAIAVRDPNGVFGIDFQFRKRIK